MHHQVGEGITIPRCHTSPGRLSGELSKHAIRFVQDVSLLLNAHVGWVLVGVSMEADLMPRVTDGGHLLRERLEGMTRNKPGCLDSIFVKKLQKTSRSDGTRPDT